MSPAGEHQIHFRVAQATETDAAAILFLIKDLAAYEKEPDAVETTEKMLLDEMSKESPGFTCILAWDGDTPVGMALYFFNYSTWRGRQGLYLEDLYVRPQWRGKGVGKTFLALLAYHARERGCVRMEWCVLDWNTPAIDFYKSIGAYIQEGWSMVRLHNEYLINLAAEGAAVPYSMTIETPSSSISGSTDQ